MTAAAHTNGGRIFAQLMHSGRVGHPETVGYRPVAPSAVALKAEVFTPKGLLRLPCLALCRHMKSGARCRSSPMAEAIGLHPL